MELCQVSPVEAITQQARSHNYVVDTVLSDSPSMYPVINTIASSSSVCLVFVGLFLVEGWDRSHLKLDNNGEDLIREVEKGCAGEVVVVMHVGGQVVVEDWVRRPRAIQSWSGIVGRPDRQAETRGAGRSISPRSAGSCSLDIPVRRAGMP